MEVLAAVRGDGFALTYSEDILQLTKREGRCGVSKCCPVRYLSATGGERLCKPFFTNSDGIFGPGRGDMGEWSTHAAVSL